MENAVSLSLSAVRVMNFAMQQNCIPVIRSVNILNNTNDDIKNLKLIIRTEPSFAAAYETELYSVPKGRTVEISPVKLSLSTDYLFSLTEKVMGSITAELYQGESLIAKASETIEILAADEWPGTLVMPEMTAAFVTPNHPAVSGILTKASVYLSKWSGSPSFSGYTTRNPNIVKQQAAAIYAALQEKNIAYILPPSSFEKTGQRIRFVPAVMNEKHGTCMDLSLLYASCLEAAGLNPILIFTQSHAFTGFWLEQETFPECADDDITALTKRAVNGIDRICLVECTDFTAGKSTDFEISERNALEHLKNPESFELFVDIKRCRGSSIRPVPLTAPKEGSSDAVDYGRVCANEITSAPSEIEQHTDLTASSGQVLTKRMIWERKLLDLSLRNSLLNFRSASSNIQLMATDLTVLEDEISKGEEFRIMAMPSDLKLIPTENKIFDIEANREIISSVSESEFRSHRIRTFTSEAELEKVLKKLHRQAKVSIEENGANTLYLAAGFLRWYETDRSERPRYAPLILIPVDIVRKIQDRSYSLRMRDEDVQMNVTLLEMLRQDFGIVINGLNPLPADENGTDMKLVFNTMRQGIMAKKRWDIEELAFIGQFSFSQFIMWNDIRNRADDLEKNKVVKSLMSGKTEWVPEETVPSPSYLDENLVPGDMAVPTSADSSQLAAIYEASRGQSFVLHGPPGTGKSQTITNMIANALYQGKSVLFVAEKMAALSVVQKRLAKIGLAPFCLELHSNKAQKRSVLKQLENTLETGHIKSPEEFSATAEKLHSLRKELNDTMKQLYTKRWAGLSVYDAVVEYERVREYDGRLTVFRELLATADELKYSEWKEAVKDTADAGAVIGSLKASPLRNCRLTGYTMEIRDGFRATAEKLSLSAKEAATAFESLEGAIGTVLPKNKNSFLSSAEIIRTLTQSDRLIPDIVSSENSDILKNEIEKIITSGEKYNSIKTEYNELFENSIWSYDADKALIEWKKAQQSWLLAKSIGTGKILKELKLYAKNPDTVTKDNITDIFYKLSEHKQLAVMLNASNPSVISSLGALWNGENSNFSLIKASLEESLRIRALITPEIKNAAVKIISDVDLAAGIKKTAADLYDKVRSFTDLTDMMKTLYKTEAEDSENYPAETAAAALSWAENADLLRDRAVLETAVTKLYELGLKETADAYLNGEVAENELSNAFTCAVSKAVITMAIEKEPLLASFQGAQFENTITKYKNFCARFEELTIEELVSKLSAKIPDTSSASAGSSEIGILRKAIKSGGRNMPIRKLFDSIPTLLRRICPCMLMSPISVAQYIDPSYPKFDLVIFDEASQLPTSEAVGAIARGENVVVVGDPNQLPPTSFFNVNQTDEENYDMEDLESVLDDCLALSIPQRHLLWHYRSRHESLIAYSNSRYYENKLRTFPSPDDLISKVSWVKVEGFYDKGGTKQNIAEAEAITAEIVRRLSDEELRKESIGVVTFSVVQQVLIDDMIAEEFRKNPQLEQYANEMHEPILVKNLENVQGDERDVILFSVGYGPDKNGKVSMNFGPLNQDGGWRRLNVAISRSRKAMIVYSVITPEQIDLSRTSSDGVAGLKGFLDFAAKGNTALPVRAAEEKTEEDSFTETVCSKLKELGYNVRTKIGCSDYKIDIGVVNPDNEGAYILGIMCGGKGNFSLTTARDRNILQPSVLVGLGWKIVNVHILDWLDNPEKVTEQLKAVIDKTIADYKANPDKPQVIEETPKREIVFEKIETPEAETGISDYIPYKPREQGSSEDFKNEAEKENIKEIILEAAEAEAPLSRKLLYKYVLSSYGISRTSPKYEQLFSEALSECGVLITTANENEFIWKADQKPDSYDICRRSPEGVEKRALEDIAPEEISAAIMLLLKNQISMSREDIIKETAKIFGYTRAGSSAEAAIALGIAKTVRSGKAMFDEDRRIKLKD